MNNSKCPLVSVIIPVFNDSDALQLCLAALTKQTYRRSHYEIIVVDNGSDNWQQIKTIVDSLANASFTQELTPGSYAARNKGIDKAKGEVIAFTDADCIPAPDWLEQGVKTLLDNPNCGLVGGQIKLFFRNFQKPNIIELYESVRSLPQQEFIEQDCYGATANVFTTRQVIEAVGTFNTELKSSGDLEWGQRVYVKGYTQVYSELAIVRHPTRSSWQEFYNRTCRLAGGHYDLKLQRANSVIQRQIVFLQTLAINLTPPVFFTVSTFLDRRLQGIGAKLKVSLMMVVFRYISAWETLQIKLGKASSRI